MKPQRLLVPGLLLAAAVIVAVIWLVPRLSRPATLSGYVEGEPLYLASPVSGRVDQMLVQRGDTVGAGQKLFVVDPSQLRGARDQAQAEVAAAEAQAGHAGPDVRGAGLSQQRGGLVRDEARDLDVVRMPPP